MLYCHRHHETMNKWLVPRVPGSRLRNLKAGWWQWSPVTINYIYIGFIAINIIVVVIVSSLFSSHHHYHHHHRCHRRRRRRSATITLAGGCEVQWSTVNFLKALLPSTSPWSSSSPLSSSSSSSSSSSTWGEQEWRSGESTPLPPMWPGFDSRTSRQMWVEFVVGSCPCSEKFFSGYFGFPFSSKTNISKFQFDLDYCPALYHEPLALTLSRITLLYHHHTCGLTNWVTWTLSCYCHS